MYVHFGKRLFDILISASVLFVFSPLLLLLLILGAVIMKGNPLFFQERPGWHEKVFRLVKFRTMTNERDEKGELLADEHRLNAYGNFLRNWSLDELPEFWNILKGDMSIVGPRPQLVRDMVFMTDNQRRRHSVRPGLTGLAQINGRNNISWERKLELDLQYIQHITLLEDIRIFLMTFLKVFQREGVVEEGCSMATDYGDYLLSRNLVSREDYDRLQREAKDILNAARKRDP